MDLYQIKSYKSWFDFCSPESVKHFNCHVNWLMSLNTSAKRLNFISPKGTFILSFILSFILLFLFRYKPNSVAAGAVYLVTQICGLDIDAAEIAGIAKTGTATVRAIYRVGIFNSVPFYFYLIFIFCLFSHLCHRMRAYWRCPSCSGYAPHFEPIAPTRFQPFN